MSKFKITSFVLFCALFVFAASALFAADAPVVKRGPIVIVASAHDVSPALRDIPAAPSRAGVKYVVPNRMLPGPIRTGRVGDSADAAAFEQTWSGAVAMPATIQNFEGVDVGDSPSCNCAPPDTNGAVGPNHFVQTVNTDFAVYSKTGVLAGGFPKAINTIWAGFDTGGIGENCDTNNDGDPIVVYDQIADRWVVSQFAVSQAFGGSPSPGVQCVAVSTSSDPTSTYNRYAFDYAGFGISAMNDYPKMGVWPDGYYVTYNMFNASTQGFIAGVVCAMDRTSMLSNNAATQQCFTDNGDGGLLPSTLDGSTLPPASEPNFVMQIVTNSSLRLWKFHVDWGTPANSTFGSTDIAVSPFGEACNGGACIPQPHTTQKLASLADRLMFRLAYRNFGTHESLVVNHSVAQTASKPSKRIGIRWYEIQDPNGTPTVAQQSSYIPDKKTYRWMGSIAMDKNGDIALGFSASAKKTVFPSIRVTGRLAGDPINQMTQGETTVISGTGSQTFSLSRWGDYSALTVDPTDDCTFWYTTEYLTTNGTFNWHTRIASFKFPGCI